MLCLTYYEENEIFCEISYSECNCNFVKKIFDLTPVLNARLNIKSKDIQNTTCV